MRRALLALLMLSATPAAATDDAPSCRLAPAECAVVLREVAIDAELSAQDQKIVGLGLSPLNRAEALIRRDEDRMAVRFQQLPAPVAAEIARVQTCQALARAVDAAARCR